MRGVFCRAVPFWVLLVTFFSVSEAIASVVVVRPVGRYYLEAPVCRTSRELKGRWLPFLMEDSARLGAREVIIVVDHSCKGGDPRAMALWADNQLSQLVPVDTKVSLAIPEVEVSREREAVLGRLKELRAKIAGRYATFILEVIGSEYESADNPRHQALALATLEDLNQYLELAPQAGFQVRVHLNQQGLLSRSLLKTMATGSEPEADFRGANVFVRQELFLPGQASNRFDLIPLARYLDEARDLTNGLPPSEPRHCRLALTNP